MHQFIISSSKGFNHGRYRPASNVEPSSAPHTSGLLAHPQRCIYLYYRQRSRSKAELSHPPLWSAATRVGQASKTSRAHKLATRIDWMAEPKCKVGPTMKLCVFVYMFGLCVSQLRRDRRELFLSLATFSGSASSLSGPNSEYR